MGGIERGVRDQGREGREGSREGVRYRESEVVRDRGR